jgi:hypothetical protein
VAAGEFLAVVSGNTSNIVSDARGGITVDVVRAVARLLSLGLVVESALTAGGYVVKVSGGKTAASGHGETFLEAFWRASWRWTQD